MAIYCIVWTLNTFLKYSLISGAMLTIDFAIFCPVKEFWNISEKDWLNLSNQQFLLLFFYTQKTPKRVEHSWDQGIVSLKAIYNEVKKLKFKYFFGKYRGHFQVEF